MTTDAGRQAATALRALREQWGDLLAAIERAYVPTEWPPRRTQERAQDEAMADRQPTVGRLPLVLREHPAPVNVAALDAALSIERAVFTACDAVAGRVQRPVQRIANSWLDVAAHRNDPARWSFATVRDIGPGNAASAGSRRHGLHWACVWLEGRALNEGTTAPRPSNTVHVPLFRTTPALVVDSIAEVADHARRRLETALGRDDRPTLLADPCPYCRTGGLRARTRSGDPMAAVIRCDNGQCQAPAPIERGRRTWRGADLCTLYGALSARRTAAAA